MSHNYLWLNQTLNIQAICSRRSTDTSDDFIEGLRHFDKDGNGFISSAELRHLLTTLGEKLSDEEAEQLLVGHEDNKGNINYENFVRCCHQQIKKITIIILYIILIGLSWTAEMVSLQLTERLRNITVNFLPFYLMYFLIN